jgi:glycosyltransferase involved in cell wall biosynthesis
LVEELSEYLDFMIVTADRDLGQRDPYQGIILNEWTPVGCGRVLYTQSGLCGSLHAWAVIRQEPFDVLYLNSFFSPAFSFVPLVMRRLGLLRRTPVILAPRGEFASAALRRKGLKKSIYRVLVRWTGLFTGTTWQASSEVEARDIRDANGTRAKIVIASDIGGTGAADHGRRTRPVALIAGEIAGSSQATSVVSSIPRKESGQLNLVYVGRIHPHKQLIWALQVLGCVRGQVRLDVIGPIEDGRYWQKCLQLSASMREGSSMRYNGKMSHDEVLKQLETHHALFLPSLSENYGHSIVEALSVGRPVIVGDLTPWHQLQQSNAGWDIPAGDLGQYIAAVQTLVDCRQEEYSVFCDGALHYYQAHCNRSMAIEENHKLFALVLTSAGLEQ